MSSVESSRSLNSDLWFVFRYAITFWIIIFSIFPQTILSNKCKLLYRLNPQGGTQESIHILLVLGFEGYQSWYSWGCGMEWVSLH